VDSAIPQPTKLKKRVIFNRTHNQRSCRACGRIATRQCHSRNRNKFCWERYLYKIENGSAIFCYRILVVVEFLYLRLHSLCNSYIQHTRGGLCGWGCSRVHRKSSIFSTPTFAYLVQVLGVRVSPPPRQSLLQNLDTSNRISTLLNYCHDLAE
jgi:hypothetical protein